jgi:hypothetical protein
MQVILLITVLVVSLLYLRTSMINSFKIGFYEQKLKNRGVDIVKVENMSFLDIWRL